MQTKSQTGRRYSIRVGGDLIDPEIVRDVLGLDGERVYNPRGLKASAVAVASALAVADDVEVEVVKHLASTERVEASISSWDVRASRAIGR